MNVLSGGSETARFLDAEPSQPNRSEWGFVRELQQPLWKAIHWTERPPRANEADLREGVSWRIELSDPASRLETAWRDLEHFLFAAAISLKKDGDAYPVVFAPASDLPGESYRITVTEKSTRIESGGTEGFRRAIYALEDLFLRSGGPFLPLGVVERRAVVRTRISRCFFGPTRRPPHNWDELMDDVDYYPDSYLNKLAYEGVNGLWLTVHFDEVCRTNVLPQSRPGEIERRLAKLRSTVEKCARYGIKIYLFCNEPRPLTSESEWGKLHPELLGSRLFDHRRHHFCTSSETAQAYLEDALFRLFSDVPGLGGLINITVGEGLSHCCSDQIVRKNECPRCAGKSHHEVLFLMLEAMERGMHRAAPDAELISWPYFQFDLWGDKETAESAGRQPPGIILQQNFESSGEVEQCGRVHKILDYWLSWPGPSQLFVDCARAAARSGIRMGAKLQVGCSHEVATVPYLPVPGILYRKYRAIHDLGVSSVMQCWYFGNYPGVMTKAAGELSFAPLPETEREFLVDLARPFWGPDAEVVADAWEWFRKGYSHFPMNHVYGWFGPVHDAVVWPLYLEPVDRGLAQSWQIEPPSGDRFAESFAYTHSLEEVLSLTRRMADEWAQGVALLRSLPLRFENGGERRKEIGIAVALGIQFESAANMTAFYAHREELPHRPPSARRKILQEMQVLVEREIAQSAELISLCEDDPRLGFHSEAEGYKYFPEKLRWRIDQLKGLLEEDFARVESSATSRQHLWPAYTGHSPEGLSYRCRPAGDPDAGRELLRSSVWIQDETGHREKDGCGVPPASWSAVSDDEAVALTIFCPGGGNESEKISVHVEPRRLWPSLSFEIPRQGAARLVKYPARDEGGWQVRAEENEEGAWTVQLRIPFAVIPEAFWPQRPVRLNIERHIRMEGGTLVQSWKPLHPLPERLVFADRNPADLGWFFLK